VRALRDRGGKFDPEWFAQQVAEDLSGWMWTKSGVGAKGYNEFFDEGNPGYDDAPNSQIMDGPKKFNPKAFVQAYKKYQAKEKGIDYESPEIAQQRKGGKSEMERTQKSAKRYIDNPGGALPRDQLKEIVLEVMSELHKEAN
jgi:hypothetical protein